MTNKKSKNLTIPVFTENIEQLYEGGEIGDSISPSTNLFSINDEINRYMPSSRMFRTITHGLKVLTMNNFFRGKDFITDVGKEGQIEATLPLTIL